MATEVGTPHESTTSRRKSGRVSQAPAVFSQEVHEGSILGPYKRKRGSNIAEDLDDDAEDEDAGDEDESDDESEEAEPDEEELREQKRKQKSKKSTTAKPATKRARTTNGTSTTLAIRSSNTAGRRASKTVKQRARARPSQVQASGLYADVFGQDITADSAAAGWLHLIEKDEVGAIRDIVNLMLQVIGCDARIENQDIEDVDNVTNRLDDVLTQYDAQNQADYPLSGKQKQFAGMRDVLYEFFKAIIHVLHASGWLYRNQAIYDNIHVWAATMSGAAHRSFRHTSTIIELAMTTALSEVAKELEISMATTKQQLETETKKKKGQNKARITQLEKDSSKEQKQLSMIDELLKDAFDTVYVHRYRDVDDKIRVECVEALGNWIQNYRTYFLEGSYLRYWGWIISDPSAHTRIEVVRQLKALVKHKQNVSPMRAFFERFRSRIVEMGTRDADASVRVEAIELLDRLRDAELLEPDDVDTIGQLVFDNEPRVRKAVAKFFVSNIEDAYEAIVEDFDQEQFNDSMLNQDDVTDYDQPAKSWIKFKCLAQTLAVQREENSLSASKGSNVFGTEQADSRYMITTQAIFKVMPELEHWQSIAGYLLHDHSSVAGNTDTTDTTSAIKEAYKIEDGEDIVLLDVLYSSAKVALQDALDAKTKKAKGEHQMRSEAATQVLSTVIPQLHSKYGSSAHAAASILRLYQLYDADLVDDLRAANANHTTLLDVVEKQFTAQTNAEVLAEASRALRAAQTHENSKEAADAKIVELWSESSSVLAALLNQKNYGARGTLDRNALRQIVDVANRLSSLAGISDCTHLLEARMQWPKAKAKQKRTESLFDVLLELLKRGQPDDSTPEQMQILEDQLCSFVTRVLLFYIKWKILALQNAIRNNATSSSLHAALSSLSVCTNDFVTLLSTIIAARKPLDEVRTTSLLVVTEVYVLLATIRALVSGKSSDRLDEDTQSQIQSLSSKMSSQSIESLLGTHEKMEKRLARRLKKKIDLPLSQAKKAARRATRNGSAAVAVTSPITADKEAVDRPPEDSDDEAETQRQRRRAEASDSDLSSETETDEIVDQEVSKQQKKEAKQKATLLAETGLCEFTAKIVFAIVADVLSDPKAVRERLQVNRHKLGKSYNQVIGYLDERKDKSKSKSRAGASGTAPTTPARATSSKGKKSRMSEPMVLEDDDIEDDEQLGEDDDPEVLREKGLEDEDDPIEENENEENVDEGTGMDVDDGIGD